MALSFAGIGLNLLPVDYREWLETYHSLDDFLESELWDVDRSNLEHLPLPPEPVQREPRVGTLVWPNSFTRCGFAHYVIDTTALDAINEELGDSAGPADLVMTDGTGNTRTFSLYKLTARPLSKIASLNGAHLLTLVDERWYRRTLTGSITTTPSSWASLFSSLASQLGITLTVDTVAADYGAPTSQWKFTEKNLSVVLDAACNRVGQRLVANLDGTYKTVNYATAAALAASQSSLTKTAGGLLETDDLIYSVPAEVKVVFRDSAATTPHTVTKTLTSLSLSDYGASSGVSGSSVTIFGELIHDNTNTTACASYATQAATDWYDWQLVDLDLSLTGLAEWEPTGAEDRIEWKYDSDRLLTRVLRGPFQSFNQGSLWQVVEDSSPPSTSDCTGCGWLEDLRLGDCLKVSLVSATGACGCASTIDDVWLVTSDGVTWGSPDGGGSDGGGTPVTYNCVGGFCVEAGVVAGDFPSLAACVASGCTSPPPPPPPPPVTYNCVSGTCSDPGDGTGTYATLADCTGSGCAAPPADTTACCPSQNPLTSATCSVLNTGDCLMWAGFAGDWSSGYFTESSGGAGWSKVVGAYQAFVRCYPDSGGHWIASVTDGVTIWSVNASPTCGPGVDQITVTATITLTGSPCSGTVTFTWVLSP